MTRASGRTDVLLVLDDDPGITGFLHEALEEEGREILTAACGADARAILAERNTDVALLDISLPDVSGLEILKEYLGQDSSRMAIMMTGKAEEEVVVEAMRAGAMDYVVKPISAKDLRGLVDKAFELRRRNLIVRSDGPTLAGEEGQRMERYLIGRSPPMIELFKTIGKLALSDLPVLVTGESGTGKELVARALHRYGSNRGGPFVPVDCGSVPAGLLEAELFGYERGAFTDAVSAKPGRFEQAEGGTLFLDEIGNIPIELQAKLLRALQEKMTQRLGSTRAAKWSARVISATNVSPRQLVEQGKFRSDLLYRIAGAELKVPPLRERISDLALLAAHFLSKWEGRKGQLAVDDGAMELMSRYPWPGNIRELEHTMDRAAAMVRGNVIGTEELPEEVRGVRRAGQAVASSAPWGPDLVSLEEMKRRHARHVLEACGGNKTETARILKIDRKTLASLLEE